MCTIIARCSCDVYTRILYVFFYYFQIPIVYMFLMFDSLLIFFPFTSRLLDTFCLLGLVHFGFLFARLPKNYKMRNMQQEKKTDTKNSFYWLLPIVLWKGKIGTKIELQADIPVFRSAIDHFHPPSSKVCF